MKIRNGFVSNSSSSSFIIKKEDFDKIECPNCKRLISVLMPEQKAQDFLDEHWCCVDYEDNSFGVKADDIIYAAHIVYHNELHDTLEEVLTDLGINFTMENE